MTALRPVELCVGLVPTVANVEIPWAAKNIDDNGEFIPLESQERVLTAQLDELVDLDGVLRPLRAARA